MDKKDTINFIILILPLIISIYMLTYFITSPEAKAIVRGECIIHWAANNTKEHTGLYGNCRYLNKLINPNNIQDYYTTEDVIRIWNLMK